MKRFWRKLKEKIHQYWGEIVVFSIISTMIISAWISLLVSLRLSGVIDDLKEHTNRLALIEARMAEPPEPVDCKRQVREHYKKRLIKKGKKKLNKLLKKD